MATITGQDTTQLTGDATITWGDGNQSAGTITITGPDSFTVAGTNTYLEEGLYNLTVDVGLVGGGYLEGQGMAQVADAALSGTGTTVTAIQNVPTGLVQVADFTDDDPGGTLADYSAIIDWGDNTTSSGQIQSDGNGGYEVLGNHTYLTAGSFTITTTIADSGGSSLVVTSTTQAPNPSATGIGILEGQIFNFYLPLALPLSPGQQPPASFTAGKNGDASYNKL
jgi:hypothetical protein